VDILKAGQTGSVLPAGAALVNVCSYPSAGNGGNNNPFDCIVPPQSGFLQIVKNIPNIPDSTFSFDVKKGNTSLLSPMPSIIPANAIQTGLSGQLSSPIGLDLTNTYSVIEQAANGWSLDTASSKCRLEDGTPTGPTSVAAAAGVAGGFSGIVVQSGKTTTCTFYNTRQTGTLIVEKIVVNDNAGTAKATDFSFQIDGQTIGFQQDGLNILKGKNTLQKQEGTYTITEPAVAGYATTYNNCTNVQLVAGTTQTCTITNNDIAPKLTVTKVVVNDDGGGKQISDFPLFVDGISVKSGDQNTFNAGSHVVSETNQTGYNGTITGDCAADGSITLKPGDVKACTITNNDVGPKLTVTKIVINNNGGTKQVKDFPLFVDVTAVTSGVPGSFRSRTAHRE
jgi:hypothetical protein